MTKADMLDPTTVDKRIMERKLYEGDISRKEYASFLESLPDLADQCDDIAPDIFKDEEETAPATKEA